MPVADELYGKDGQYLLLLDANNAVIGVYKRGDDTLYMEKGDPKGRPFEYSKIIEMVRTGTSSDCWYKTSTGAYIRVPC
jgi:hypothetical protein